MDLPVRRPRHQFRDQLREILTRPGPYLSVYLDLSRGSLTRRLAHHDVASDLSPLQRHEAEQQLAAAQASNEEGMLAMLVAADGAACTATFPEPPPDELVALSDLPRLAPFIESEQSMLHHVVAIVDADELNLGTFPRHGEPSHQHLRGGDPDASATLIARAARQTNTPFVVLCGPDGPIQSTQHLLRSRLPVETALATIEYSSDVDDLAHEMVRAVADQNARTTVELLRLFRFERTHSAAVEGIVDVVHALEREEVAVLLAHDDPDDQRMAWFGETFDRVAVDIEDAVPIDPSERLRPGRLIDVLLRSALGQRRPTFIVPSLPDDRLREGVGALLIDEQDRASALRDLVE